jgi:hypothetical protein
VSFTLQTINHKAVIEWVALALGGLMSEEKGGYAKWILEGHSGFVAHGLLQWCNEDPKNKEKFWTDMYPRLLPSSQSMRNASSMAEADDNIVRSVKYLLTAIKKAESAEAEGS